MLGELSEGERAKLQRSMGLKMEQLKVCLFTLYHCCETPRLRTV